MDTRKSRMDKAKKQAFDEYYTRYEDIEKELIHYEDQLRGKKIFCNCDDIEASNFLEYLCRQGPYIGIEKVTGVRYEGPEATTSYSITFTPPENLEEYNADDWKNYLTKTPIEGNGDFRSEASIKLLEESDVVITNPPFSIFADFIDLLIEKEKKFLIIANQNCVTYKNVFPLFKNNKIWFGYLNMGVMYFRVPDYYKEKLINENKSRKIINEELLAAVSAIWLTNIENNRRNEKLQLVFSMNRQDKPYIKYDNYDAYECSRINEIPYDSDDKVLGVPISYLAYHNPDQFEILGSASGVNGSAGIPWIKYENIEYINKGKRIKTTKLNDGAACYINNLVNDGYYIVNNNEQNKIVRAFNRIFIRRRQEEN